MRGSCSAAAWTAPDPIDDLVAEHATSVLAYVRAILKDHHASEDVVQETMLRAWQHESRLRADCGSVHGWLLTVARNLALDRLRSAASRHELLSSHHHGDPYVDDPRGSSRLVRHGRTGGGARPVPYRTKQAAQQLDHADAIGQRDEVISLLSGLPTAHREVLAWTYLVDLGESETAQALGVPAGTVKSRRHYALAELRRRAARHED